PLCDVEDWLTPADERIMRLRQHLAEKRERLGPEGAEAFRVALELHEDSIAHLKALALRRGWARRSRTRGGQHRAEAMSALEASSPRQEQRPRRRVRSTTG